MTDPTPIPEQPTAPRTLRQRAAEHVAHPDAECEACVEIGLVRSEAAASVRGPEQEEAVRRAIAIVEDSRQTHVHWAEWRRIGGTGDDMAGDLAHHEEAIKGYDHVLSVLRALATPPPVPAAPLTAVHKLATILHERESAGKARCGTNSRGCRMRHRMDATSILSAVPAAPRLDVERLAAALDVLSEDGLEYDLMAPEEREDRDDAAERLAAEYARLHPADPEAPDDATE